MVFKRKESFFLDLGSEGARPASVAVARPAPAPEAPRPQAPAQSEPVPASAAPPTPRPAEAVAPQLTTAEAIAAELKAAQEALPAPSLSTFAPEALNPGNGLRPRRRLAGANLAGFKAMAASLTGK
ncbi:MAG: hypothetical protein VKK98_02160 [Cyanobacteriota bacterium]|nr:hypothetical protein [Cyanobacteriota bacterium]